MAWKTENRRLEVVEKPGTPYLTDALRKYLEEKYVPRYPTRRAVLIPALHLIQHTYGWIPTAAMEELAGFIGCSPAETMDTATFYEEFWLKPKGKYLLQVCRSLTCEICESGKLADHVKRKLNVEHGQTTPDGRFTFVELECLGACGTAPVALVNEVLHENLTVEKFDQIMSTLPADPAEYHDPTITWAEEKH